MNQTTPASATAIVHARIPARSQKACFCAIRTNGTMTASTATWPSSTPRLKANNAAGISERERERQDGLRPGGDRLSTVVSDRQGGEVAVALLELRHEARIDVERPRAGRAPVREGERDRVVVEAHPVEGSRARPGRFGRREP